jgi:CBS domain-containing protein
MNTTSKPLAKLTADDLMSRDLLVLSDDTPLREAAHMLIRHQVSGAPVIDRHGNFAGILSALDFVRAVNDADGSPGEPTRNPLACRFQSHRPDAASRSFCTLPMGSCAVQQVHIDAGGRRWAVCSQPHEMFVDWQVTEVESLPAGTVGQFMTRDVVTVNRSTPVREIARMMIDAHIHRVVVMENDRYPVGIVTSTDILGAVAALGDALP